MDIIHSASAETMESNDCLVTVEPSAGGIRIEVESIVWEQYGDAITQTVRDVAEQWSISGGLIRVVDRGALDCVLRARTEAAILRTGGITK